MTLKLPQKTKTEQGTERHVGFEFEYSGISLDDSVSLVAGLVKGSVRKKNAFLYEIEQPEFGPFGVELDASLLKEEKYKQFLGDVGIDLDELDQEKKLERVLKDLAETVVPVEIVSPPLPMSKMNIVEDLTETLRKGKAKGSGASILYAFGLHINIEACSQEADYLLSHIRAYALLYDWICEVSDVDLTRQVSRYIKEYPDDYLEVLLDNDYRPDINGLIDDYLRLVKSRNFALDMMPCFADIDEDKVMRKATEPELIKPRPAFHYRLPNCLIDEEDWNVANEWQYWLAIEKLAANSTLLEQLTNDYWNTRRGSLFATKGKWVDHLSSQLS
ncbi:MAG: amidoligase family protein [Gammaproteobacteria bacterium]